MRCSCCWRDRPATQRRPAISSNPAPLDSISAEPQGRQERLFLLLSIFIGVISGLLVVSFRMAIEWLKVLLLGSSIEPHQFNLIFVPVIAGIVIAVLTRFVFPQVTGSGINQTKTAMYIHNGYISFRTVIGKFLLSALAIGSGYSLGPEDPSLQIGAGVASLVSRRFGLSNARLRLFAPIGAAAGLAAAFNAPISAILFVIEEVIGHWSADVLGSIVLSAISSVVVARAFWGAAPMFSVPAVTLRDPRELAAYAVMGVLGGGAAFLFARSLEYLRPWARRKRPTVRMIQPAVAGLLVGCIGYFGLPQVMGAGYGAIDQAMHAQFAWKMLLLLALFKLIATTLSFSSGTPGGMFAPTLFVGAMLGAGVGSLGKIFLPYLTGSVASYAVVGMGVLFAAFLRAPLTSVFMAMEISGNYSIVVPVILANTIAYLISRSLQPAPIFEVLTQQDGLWLPSMEEQREERDLRLEDALQRVSVPVLEGSGTVQETLAFLRREFPYVMVRCAKGLWYVAEKQEIDALRAAAAADENVRAAPLEEKIGPARTPMLFPDLTLSSALPYFHRWPLLPVMNRAARGALEGTITLEDVLRRYQQE
jgi:CIC family chloride channel protein